MRAVQVDSSKVILQQSLYSKITTLLLVMLAFFVAAIFIVIEITYQPVTNLQLNTATADSFTPLKVNLLFIILPLLLVALVITKLILHKLIVQPLAQLQQQYHRAIVNQEQHKEVLVSPYIEFNELVNLLNAQIEITLEPRVNEVLLAQSKQQFVENLITDIRTPMNSILGVTELLAETPQNIKSAEYLKLLKQSVKQLQMLLNDVADYSRVESGNLDVEAIRFDLLAILDQVYTRLRPSVNHNLRVRFSLNYAADLHRFYIGDPIRLQQVLVNVVANALKFTDRGFVELKVACTNADAINKDGNIADLVFTISDSGIGIPVTKLAHLFDPEKLSYNHKGNDVASGGLNLAICSRLINLMQGNLQVDSTLGEGVKLKINLSLPRAHQLRPQHIVGSTDLVLAKLVGLKVLLIEENKINQIVFQQVLAQLQMQVFTATTGLQALMLMQKYNFDVIYLQFPGENGLATMKMIRMDNSENSNKPLIALAEDLSQFDLINNKYTEIDGCINDPISKQALIDETVRVLGFASLAENVVQPINKKI